MATLPRRSFISSFQFHKGAIRTIENKVERITNANFNSIKVRLERGDAAQAPGVPAVFQFHKGAIRTEKP